MNKLSGSQWLRSFLQRHPDLSIRKPEGVTNASANVTEYDIRKWFKEVKEILAEEGVDHLLNEPSRLLNGDEACFWLDPTADRVIAKRGERNVYKVDQGPSKKNITTMFTCAADGTMYPPCVVLPYKKIPMQVIQSVPSDWGLGKTDSGWMTRECFLQYVKKVLHPQIVRAKIPLPVIYFIDGHSSHTPWETADECKQLGIILVCLYANSTRILQPLDVAVFKPLKQSWLRAVDDWKMENPNNHLKTENFAPMLQRSMLALDNSIIKSGFKACGLYPFDANAVDYTKCLGRKATSSNDVSVSLESKQTHDTNEPKQTSEANYESITVHKSDAEDILRMMGPERIHRYRNIQLYDFESEEDHILYKVHLMLSSLDTQLETEHNQDEYLDVSYLQKDPPECSTSLSINPDYNKLASTDDETFKPDTHNEELVVKNGSSISKFLDSPETPHRKGNRQYQRRSPAVLTSCRRLVYHQLKATQKCKDQEVKQQKSELKAAQKAKKEEVKQQKSELRKKKQAAKNVKPLKKARKNV